MTYIGDFPVGRITFGPKVECTIPNCPICAPGLRPLLVGDWTYQTTTKPNTGAVVDFTTLPDTFSDDADFSDDDSCDCCEQPMSNTERVTDLEEDVQNLRAAVLDLTQVIEYLLIWTGKKGNKMDRDKYLNGYIDAIRVIL